MSARHTRGEVDIADLPGMKHRDFEPCIGCDKGVMHAGSIVFARVSIERFVVDIAEVRKAHGLELLMGGHAALANAMGPDADLAKRFSKDDVLLCDDCFTSHQLAIFRLLDRAMEREEKLKEQREENQPGDDA